MQNEPAIELSIPHPSPPSFSLAFLNLRYEVTNYGQVGWPKKALLRRLNGSFHAGSLNGLLGESGSGKTTLLSALCGKATSGLTASSSLYLGQSVPNSSSVESYFVQQHILETIEGSLTVGQLLQYAFLFKNGLGRQARARMAGHISRVTQQLLLNSAGLMERRFSVCSGGEQRRVSVAQELMSLRPPSFLFLDEPTTGLDSYAALELVRCLSELTLSSNQNLTIVASIHAPSSELLTYFSKLLVLAKGVAIYSGPPGSLKSVLEEQLGKGVLGKSEQPIEALIRISCASLGDQDDSGQLQKLAQHALQTEYEGISREIASSNLQPLPSGLPNNRKPFSFCDLYLATCRHFRVTFLANFIEMAAKLVFLLVTIAVFSTFYNSPAMVLPDGCYEKLPPSNLTNSQCSSKGVGRSGGSVLRDFHLTENINFQSLNRDDNIIIIQLICALLYSRLAKVFRSEHRNRWYSLGVFYLATDLVTSLQTLLFTITISVFSYFIVSEHAIDNYTVNWTRLGHFITCTGLYLTHSQALGQLNGVLFAGSQEMTVVMAFFLNTMHFLLNDFFFKTADVSLYGYRLLADILGMKHITRYLVYIFYGIDRCTKENEASWVLERYDVPPQFEQLLLDLLLVIVLKTVLIKVATFALMYGRWGSFSYLNLWWLFRKGFSNSVSNDYPSPMPIDFPAAQRHSKLENGFHYRNENVVCKGVSLIKNEPPQRIIIAWRDLSLLKSRPFFEISRYTSLDKNKTSQPETVLNNLNGAFTFGSLNAVMGMSGAGKTTFLRLLNGQEHGRLHADSRLYLSNGKPLQTVFITQEVDGHLMNGLTARQLLIYASKLKNVQAKRGVDHPKIALRLLEELNLVEAANTKVQYLSGGEKKRLALASELTSTVMPNLILVDEICSGLDSNSAAVTIATLRSFTHSHPITIVVSIHQPNSELLSLFDSLYVLSAGGHAVYSGPPDEVQRHLNKLEQFEEKENTFTKNELESEYPIEQLIKYSSLRMETSAIAKQLKILTKLATTEEKLEKALLEETIPLEDDSVFVNRVRFSLASVAHLSSRYLAYMVSHHWKQWLPFALFYLIYALNLRFFFSPVIATAAGCISIDSDFNASHSVSICSPKAEAQATEEKLLLENVVYNFFFSCFFLLIVLMQTPLQLFYELPLFANEHRNGWYSTGSWYLTKVIFELVPLIPVLAAYVYVVDIFEGVQTASSLVEETAFEILNTEPSSFYWTIFGVMLISVATAQGYTYLVLLAVGGVFTTSLVLGLTSMIVMIQLSNVFSPLATAHYIHQALSYLAIPRWPLQALMVRQYGFGRCGERTVQPILHYMALEDEDFGQAVLWMVANCLIYKGVALWWLVRRMNSSQRGSKRSKERKRVVADQKREVSI